MIGSAIEWARIIVWPIVVVIALVGLTTRPGQKLVSWLRERLKRVEVLGIKVELTEEAARETKETVEQSFAKLRDSLHREFDGACRRSHLRDALGYVTDAALSVLADQTTDVRATIYVEDALLNEI